MIFWRITDNKVLPVGEVKTLGFEECEGMRIPDEYLQEQEFVIMRGCHGIGDYGIISAMPRLLKEKYPNLSHRITYTKNYGEGIIKLLNQSLKTIPTSMDSVMKSRVIYFMTIIVFGIKIKRTYL